MEQKTLLIGSVTRAQRARSLLLARAITVRLVRARQNNCSYSLSVSEEMVPAALAALEEAGIRAVVK